MNTPLPIMRLPNGYVCLENDTNLPARALEQGTIEIEGWLNHSIPKRMQPGMHVVDVGAFIGDTATTFLRRGCNVTALEPFYDAFVCCVLNCHNAVKQSCYNPWFRVHNLAVGSGENVKLVHEAHGGNLGMRRVQFDPEGMPCVRLDSWVADHVDLLKIDAEGSEMHVLWGAKQVIIQHRPIIILEIFDELLQKRGSSRAAVEKFLSDHGYKLELLGEEPRFEAIATP